MLIFLLISVPLLLPANLGVSGVCTDAEQKELLDATNVHRAKHSVPALTLDPTIVAVAQGWADVQAANGSDNHSGNGKYGENLYTGFSALNAIDLWYAEWVNYTSYGGEPKNSGLTGHFTQLVWKSSITVGCGCSDYKEGIYKKIIICDYFPPGNHRGEYAVNVFPPK